MRRYFTCLVLVLLVLSAVPGMAWERALEAKRNRGGHENVRNTTAELYAWRNQLFGDVNVEGLNISLRGDGDFKDKTRGGFILTHKVSKRSNLALAYNSFQNSGNINKVVTFKNQNYQAGASADIDMHWFDISWNYLLSTWDPSDHKRQSGYLDAILGVKSTKANLDLTGNDPVTGATLNNGWSKSFPIPYIGLGIGTQLGESLWLNSHIKYISVNAGGGHAKTTDFDINVAYRVNQRSVDNDWFIVLGYRNFKIDGEFDNDKVNIGYRGPIFGVMGRF